VETTQKALTDRQTALTAVLGNMTEVDMADAVSRLQLAQTALQASTQAFSVLHGSTLLDLLSR
jgi:flagellar hook-associated protein 3 FlgL